MFWDEWWCFLKNYEFLTILNATCTTVLVLGQFDAVLQNQYNWADQPLWKRESLEVEVPYNEGIDWNSRHVSMFHKYFLNLRVKEFFSYSRIMSMKVLVFPIYFFFETLFCKREESSWSQSAKIIWFCPQKKCFQ